MTPPSSLACIVLAAGRGTRMRSDLPKVLHPLAGLPMLGHVLRAAQALEPQRIGVIVGPEMPAVAAAATPYPTFVQIEQRGTADAVRAAEAYLHDFNGDVLVLFGDTPLVTSETLQRMRAARAEHDAAIVIAAFETAIPGAYGRVVTDNTGCVTAIIEAAEATPAQQQALTLCNGGLMLLRAPMMWALLARITNHNSKQEYYLTDAPALAHAAGMRVVSILVNEEDVLGINDRCELACAEQRLQQRLRRAAMQSGVTLCAPETVFFSYDTVLGRDTVVEPNVVFGPGVTVAERGVIRAFSHLEGVQINAGARIGPYARLRPGTHVGKDAHIGNFVELKNAVIGGESKINHLSYIGDAAIGSASNIGAGTITCNYDGLRKHRTTIGNKAFIGSNTALVAPITIGDGAFVGAGSVITNDVPADTLAVARGRQVNLDNWGKRRPPTK